MSALPLSPDGLHSEPDWDDWVVADSAGISIRLRGFRTRSCPRGTALLLAGGNTSGETFLVPQGGLVHYLQTRGWDVWIADWRGSPHILGPILLVPAHGGIAAERARFTLDEAAERDVVVAVEHVNARRRGASFAVLGHCLGGAIASMALSRGLLQNSGITSFVFTTMSLIFKVPWDGRVKAEDFSLERALAESPQLRAVDPKCTSDWPAHMQEGLRRWPSAWLSGDASTPAGSMLRALTVMFGSPYEVDALHPALTDALLLTLFGPMHLGLYLHVAQNVRRGYSHRFGELDVIDVPRSQPGPLSDLVPTHFLGKRITLIGGSENRLWHRESIDQMYEWLRSTVGRGHFQKHVYPGVGMQELFWARNPDPVYDSIERAF